MAASECWRGLTDLFQVLVGLVGLVVVVAIFIGDGRGVGWCGDGIDTRIVSLRCNVLLVSS